MAGYLCSIQPVRGRRWSYSQHKHAHSLALEGRINICKAKKNTHTHTKDSQRQTDKAGAFLSVQSFTTVVFRYDLILQALTKSTEWHLKVFQFFHLCGDCWTLAVMWEWKKTSCHCHCHYERTPPGLYYFLFERKPNKLLFWYWPDKAFFWIVIQHNGILHKLEGTWNGRGGTLPILHHHREGVRWHLFSFVFSRPAGDFDAEALPVETRT